MESRRQKSEHSEREKKVIKMSQLINGSQNSDNNNNCYNNKR